MGETRIKTADSAVLVLDLTDSGLFARLRLDYHGRAQTAFLDRDDLAALADACTVLAEELGEGERESDEEVRG